MLVVGFWHYRCMRWTNVEDALFPEREAWRLHLLVQEPPPVSLPQVQRELERVLAASQAEVAAVGFLDARVGPRPAGTVYAVIRAPSPAAVSTAHEALVMIGGLSDDDWRYGWRSIGTSLELRIYPVLADLL